MKVGFISLGCSKNLIDTEVAIGHFKNNQFEIVNNPEEADILVINTPMPDDFGVELALDYADSPMCIMLLVKDELYDQITYQVIDAGIVTISKPSTKPVVYSSMRLLSATSAKIKRMEKKNRTLEEKMADIRMINHAKWLIIDKKKVTEEEAHHMIEHHAMERRITKREAAREIIDDLED